VPTTVSSLLVFVAFLTPGFVYLVRTESRLPGQQYTVLRETAAVVSASLLANTVALSFFGLIRMVWPSGTPDAGAIVRTPSVYFRDHYIEVAAWGVGLLCASVAIAALVAVPPAWAERALDRRKLWPAPALRIAIARRRRASIAPESGWGSAFHRYPERHVHLGLRLVDGTYLYGRLLTFNPQMEEDNDRSLQLVAPIEIRTPSADDVVAMDADVLVVSASEIKTVAVHYLPAD